jgi:hypothetical protein
MININNLTTKETELQELDLFVDSEGYLQDLSEQEEINVYGGIVYTGCKPPFPKKEYY